MRRSFILCRMIRMLEALAQDSWTIPACMMYEPSSNRRALHFGYFELTDCRHGWRIYSVVAKKSVAVKKVVDVAKREKGASVKVTSVKPSASKAAAAQTTITLKQIGVQLAATHELPKQQVEALFSNMIEIIIKHLKKGAKVRISGIGILQVKKRAARMGRNPATGESMKIKPSKKVSLRVAQDLKAKI